MPVIDDHGRLFGVVNVIDALVVLVIAAIVVAGVAVVLQPTPEPTDPALASTHVTLDLGTQPDYLARAINEGDTYNPGGDTELTVTDVHLTPRADGVGVLVRARLRGAPSDAGITYAGAPPRLGRALTIATDRYEVQGRIRAIGNGSSIPTTERTVVLSAPVPTPDASRITAGDEVRVAGRTVATIDEAVAYPTDNPATSRVYVEATLVAYRQHDDVRFGNSPLRPGGSIVLPGDGYRLDGSIDRVGTGLDPGRTPVRLEATVDAETAAQLSSGDAATVAGTPVASVDSVTAYGTANPDEKRVFVGLSLVTIGEPPAYNTTALREGTTLTLRTDGYELAGTIRRVGSTDPRGDPATRTVVLRMTDVRERTADAIAPGLAERANGRTIARVTAVDVEPSPVVVTTDDGSLVVNDHPFLRDVTITADLAVRETGDRVTFKGRTLQQGSTVTIDAGTRTIEATVVAIRT